MVPPSYKLVYKPHENYSYICHKPVREMGVICTNLSIIISQPRILLNHGFYELGGYSPNSHYLIQFFYGTLTIAISAINHSYWSYKTT